MSDETDDEIYAKKELQKIYDLADNIASLCHEKRSDVIMEALAINFTFHVYKMNLNDRQKTLDVLVKKILLYCEESESYEGNDALH